MDEKTYSRITAAYALAEMRDFVAELGIVNSKPMSPWEKADTFDFSPDFYPERISLISAEGRLDNTLHFVKRHPLFEGMLQDTVVNLEYRNVYPKNCLVNENPEGEVIAGCFHMGPISPFLMKASILLAADDLSYING